MFLLIEKHNLMCDNIHVFNEKTMYEEVLPLRTKGYFIFLSIILMVSSAFTAKAYEENFDSGKADGWEFVSGEWKVEDGMLTQFGMTGRNRAAAYAVGDEAWKDYTFEVKIKPISASNYAGVMFRVAKIDGGDGNTFNSNSQYYYWLIGIGGAYSKIWQAPTGSALEQTPGDTLRSGEWNEVKVEMYGQNVKLYLNGKLQKDFDFPKSAQIEFGGIALATYNASASFDDVKVEGPGIPGLSVSSKGKLTTLWAELKRE